MQLRLPWIVSRQHLLVAVLLDGFAFVALYNGLFIQRFGQWPNLSAPMAILLISWLISSYVIGRYQGSEHNYIDEQTFAGIQLAVKTALVVTLSLGGSIVYLWLRKSSFEVNLSRTFLIPYLTYLGIVSLNIQLLHRAWAWKRKKLVPKWSFIGKYEAYTLLKAHIGQTKMNTRLEYMQKKPDETNETPIVVYNFCNESPETLKKLLVLQQKGVKIMDLQEWCETYLQRFPSELLSIEELLKGGFAFPQGTFQTRLKRLGDAVVSIVLLIITSPLLIISAICIKIEDGGPIIYSQIRNGLNGEPFTIWKLRSMSCDAEIDGAQWVKSKDTRVTKIGYFLRKTRLDELPQLWCVLIGTMSLIGPRPERPVFDETLKSINHYELRLRMRPGLSGWAQVNYPYGASVEDSANKLSYDLYYLRNFNFWLDLLIMIKTIRLVLNAKGAIPISRKN